MDLNNIASFKKEFWDRATQRMLHKSLVALPLARFGFTETNGGTRFNRPSKTRLYSVGYTAQVPMATQAIGSEPEYLDVDQTRAVPFYVDETQQIESAYDLFREFGPEAVYALRNEMDGKFLAEVVNAHYTVGKLDIEGSGTNANGITATTSNITKTLSFSKSKLYQNNVSDTRPFYVVLDPTVLSTWETLLASTGSSLGDTTLKNGYVTTVDALGLNVYRSTNLRHQVVFTSGGNPSANATVTVKGLTFKFVANPANEGEVKIGANEAASLANLAAAINGGAGGDGSVYKNFTLNASGESKRIDLHLNLVSATASATTVTIVSAGYVGIASSISGSVGETQCLAPLAQYGSVDMVIQKNITTQMQPGTSLGLLGTFVTSWLKYGIKTFRDGVQTMVGIRFKIS